MIHDERGAVTAFVVTFVFALFLVAGLVIDGGYILTTRREVFNAAESAARAGAQAVVPAGPNDGSMRLVPSQAEDLAQQQLSRLGYTGNVTVVGQTVLVDVEVEKPLTILSSVGLGPTKIHGHGEATGVKGVRAEGDF